MANWLHRMLSLCFIKQVVTARSYLMLMRLWKTHLRQSEKDSTANLEMQYPPPFAATRPSTDATFTIRPRAFLMRGRKVIVMEITPFMLTFSVLWKSSTFIHYEGPMGNERPALFTIPQSPKNKKGNERQKVEGHILCYRSALWNLINIILLGLAQYLIFTTRLS